MQAIREFITTAIPVVSSRKLTEVKLGEIAEHTFDETCLRWLTEKEHKRSLDDDRAKIEFFLGHLSGKPLSSITEDKVMKAVARMPDRKHKQIWESRRDAALRKGKPVPQYKEKLISAATRSQYLSFIRGLFRIAADEWKWLSKAPVIKTRKPISRRVKWLTREADRRYFWVFCPKSVPFANFEGND
ncbi:hypothetical protein J1782_11870 [Rahnella sp. BCC 1045]|nr:hypothetical protein [Rahnella sp. BCC 1045]